MNGSHRVGSTGCSVGSNRTPGAPPLALETWHEVALRVPQGVVCLLSAALFHELVTFSPSEVFLAIPNKAWRPQLAWPPVRYFYFSQATYSYGVQNESSGTGSVNIYSPEKTLADLLRYRHKLGEALFLEALKTYLGRRGFSVPRRRNDAALRQCGARMKDVAASVKARLLNLARREGRDFNRVLLLYLQEQFLTRLANSNYQDQFVLKGVSYSICTTAARRAPRLTSISWDSSSHPTWRVSPPLSARLPRFTWKTVSVLTRIRYAALASAKTHSTKGFASNSPLTSAQPGFRCRST